MRATYLKRFVAVSRTQRCLHGLSSLIPSEVMADHNFSGHYRALKGDRHLYRKLDFLLHNDHDLHIQVLLDHHRYDPYACSR